MRRMLLPAVFTLLCSAPALADVTKVTIANRALVADGEPFGTTGPYEKLVGRIEFALDPADRHNSKVVDLDRAARGADGRVTFSADLYVLRPAEPARGNGVLLFEVSNRGRKGLLTRFNRAPASSDPTAPADFGDGYLMREGYTLVWVGWEFDLPATLLRLDTPAAMADGAPLAAQTVVDIMVDRKAAEAVLMDSASYSPSHYPPANDTSSDDTLTVRDRYWDKPIPIARDTWRFVRGKDGEPLVHLDGDFEPGRYYQVTYRATGARVVGVGLAAMRDAASAFRYRTDLPIHGKSAYVFGASQTGRFLRQFLYDGFNADEKDRRAFDAVWSHIAGASRGVFNERFGITHSLSPFKVTRFPFTDSEQADGTRRDGLLSAYNPDQRPRVFYTNTSVEYWGSGRGAALIHTTLDGKADAPLPDNVRVYLLAGTQHGEAVFPPQTTRGQQAENPMPQGSVMRALLRGLHRWSETGAQPPESRYPRFADKTLVAVSDVRFPSIPGVGDPRRITGPARVVDGAAQPLPFLVPQVDQDGNEIAGIRVPELVVPLSTTTGWNFRAQALGNSGDIYPLMGSYLPFAATRAERESRHDPRLSIEERYQSRDEYLRRIRAAAADLVRGGYLLADDLEHVVARATGHWQFATETKSSAPMGPRAVQRP